MDNRAFRLILLPILLALLWPVFPTSRGAAPAQGTRIDQLNQMSLKRTEVDLIPGIGSQRDLFGALEFMVSDEGNAARFYRLAFPTLFRMGIAGPSNRLPDVDVADFGTVKPYSPGSASATHDTDWTNGTFDYTYATSEHMTVRSSRLSPAIVVEYSGQELVFFGGQKRAVMPDGDSLAAVNLVGNPKYLAFGRTGSAPDVHSLSHVPAAPPSGTDWLLTWLGDSSYFLVPGIPDPMAQRNVMRGVEMGDFFAGDCPFLFLFEHLPAGVRTLPDGGLALSFSQPAGYIALLPLYGDIYPTALETEAWGQSQSLPQAALDRADWWQEHLVEYPLAVREWWSYDSGLDRITVDNEFDYLKIGNAGETGTRFAPLPPMLGIAYQEGFPVGFSGTVSDSGLVTQIGPYLGIEGANSYSYTLSGLARYVQEERALGQGQVPQRILDELESEGQRVVASGHLAPFYDSPSYAEFAYLIWKNPGETPYYLLPALPHLPTGLRQSVVDYVVAEVAAYPPDENTSPLPYDVGTRRERYALNPDHVARLSNKWRTIGFYHEQGSYPPENLYALWLYYRETGPDELLDKWNALRGYTLLGGHEWATLGYFSRSNEWWYNNRERGHGGAVDTNSNITGLIGYLRLAGMAQESDADLLNKAWGFLGKQFVKRYAEGRFTQNMYRNGLLIIPPNPDWLQESSKGVFGGLLYPSNWDQPQDDVRQPYIVDEFGVFLREKHRERWFLPFMFICPELGRFLSDYLQPETGRFVDTVATFMGDWYLAYKEMNYGQERATNYPEHSHQIFMARAWILGQDGGELETYVDIPWVALGDYFYIHKLVETANAYRGVSWTEIEFPAARPSMNAPQPSLATRPGRQR